MKVMTADAAQLHWNGCKVAIAAQADHMYVP